MSSVCYDCAHDLFRGGCCHLSTEEEKRFQLPITISDVLRIKKVFPLAFDMCVSFDYVDPDVKKVFSELSSFFDRQTPTGYRIKLTINPTNNCCILLDPEKGCVLDIEHRPLICRMYPFWWKNGALGLYLSDESSCLAMKKASSDCKKVAEYIEFDGFNLLDKVKFETLDHEDWFTEASKYESKLDLINLCT